MPLFTAVLASGRKRATNFVQALCVLVSLVLDPVLVPWFQNRSGNGGIGLCLAAGISEALVVICGIALTPRGVFDRRLVRSLMLSLMSGGVMALVAHLLRPYVSPFASAPAAAAAYAGTLWVSGALDEDQMAHLKAVLGKRFSRAR
jgi:Na+-driven multidrug efflux pump